MVGYPCRRKQPDSRSNVAKVWVDGVAGGVVLVGSRCRHAVWAVSKAAEDGLIPGTFWKLRSSGKFDNPCERIQRAKFSPACWAWA
jgi:hypothetical protein